jgi:hypothetical protein
VFEKSREKKKKKCFENIAITEKMKVKPQKNV